MAVLTLEECPLEREVSAHMDLGHTRQGEARPAEEVASRPLELKVEFQGREHTDWTGVQPQAAGCTAMFRAGSQAVAAGQSHLVGVERMRLHLVEVERTDWQLAGVEHKHWRQLTMAEAPAEKEQTEVTRS
jgi:hypothetical protein